MANDGKYKTSAQKGTKVVTGSSSALKTGKSTGKYGKSGSSSKK